MKHHRKTTSLFRFSSIILCFIAATAFGGTVHVGGIQPNMHGAADALHKAKTSAHPIEDLQAALKLLREGAHDKDGHREAAMPIVAKAIGELKAGNRIAADKWINEAIGEVDKAVGAGHKHEAKHKHLR